MSEFSNLKAKLFFGLSCIFQGTTVSRICWLYLKDHLCFVPVRVGPVVDIGGVAQTLRQILWCMLDPVPKRVPPLVIREHPLVVVAAPPAERVRHHFSRVQPIVRAHASTHRGHLAQPITSVLLLLLRPDQKHEGGPHNRAHKTEVVARLWVRLVDVASNGDAD